MRPGGAIHIYILVRLLRASPPCPTLMVIEWVRQLRGRLGTSSGLVTGIIIIIIIIKYRYKRA